MLNFRLHISRCILIAFVLISYSCKEGEQNSYVEVESDEVITIQPNETSPEIDENTIKKDTTSSAENVKPQFNLDPSETLVVDSLRANWEKGETIFVENTTEWSTDQWLYFLNQLENDIDAHSLKRYRAAFMLYNSKDKRISSKWRSLVGSNK